MPAWAVSGTSAFPAARGVPKQCPVFPPLSYEGTGGSGRVKSHVNCLMLIPEQVVRAHAPCRSFLLSAIPPSLQLVLILPLQNTV